MTSVPTPAESSSGAPTFPGPSIPSSRSSVRRFLSHFRVLLWKNFLIRRRSPSFLLAELTFPVIFVCIMAAFRIYAPVHTHSACHVQSQSMPSMGLLHYLQSMVCNFNLTCHPQEANSPHFLKPDTPLFYFIHNLTDLLSNEKIQHSFTQAGLFGNTELLLELSPWLRDILTSYKNIPALFSHLSSGISLDQLDTSLIRRFSTIVCGTQENDIIRSLDTLEVNKESSIFNLTNILLQLRQSVAPSNATTTEQSPVDISLRAQIQALDLCSYLRSQLSLPLAQHWTGRLRHFLFGRVAYYPSNTFTNAIVNKANEVYRFLALVQNGTKLYFSHLRPELLSLMQNHSEGLQAKLQYCLLAFAFLSDEVNQLCDVLWHLSEDSTIKSQNNGSVYWSRALDKLDFIMAMAEHFLDCIPAAADRFIPFHDPDKFEKFLTMHEPDDLFAPLGLHFERWSKNLTSSSTLSELYSFIIRANPLLIDTTFQYKVLDKHSSPSLRRDPKSDMKYFTSGFLDLEERISQAILNVTSGMATIPHHPIGVEFQMFPGPAFTMDEFSRLSGSQLPQVMVLSWFTTVVSLVKYLVDERENGLLTILRVIGVPHGLNAITWLTVSLLFSTGTCVIQVFLLKFTGITPNTSPSLMIFLSLSYVLAVLAASLNASLLFKNATLASVVTGGVYYACYLPAPLLVHYATFLSPILLITMGVIPQVSQTFGWAYIVRLEQQGLGAQWSDLWSTRALDGPYSLGLVFGFLWLAIALQLISALYVLPWTLSTLRSSRFLIARRLSSIGRRPRRKHNRSSKIADSVEQGKNMPTVELCNRKPDEILLPHTSLHRDRPVVVVRRLHKWYPHYERAPALNGIDLEFYANQTNVLLGHNGAGKTTLLSILAGILRPSLGTVLINDQEVHHNKEYIRTRVGYCPQHEILYSDLTVSEHIRLYGSLKDDPSMLTEANINRYLAYFGFESKRDSRISTLSGGQKRRLSVCIAFLGSNVSVILLDEPTAGVDPLAKRIIWDSIQAMKKDRSVIFTSHHMREAEFLSDQISILSNGQLLQSGSCVSLKATFGLGYLLTLEKRPGTLPPDSAVSTVTNEISAHCHKAVLLADTRNTLLYRLPPEGVLNGEYVKLFEHLESKVHGGSTDYPISHFSITDTSLDDVFISILNKEVDRMQVGAPLDGSPVHSQCDSIQADAPVFSLRKLRADLVSKFTTMRRVFPSTTKPATRMFPAASNTTEDKPFWATLKSLYNQSTVILRIRYLHLQRNKRAWFFQFFIPCGILLFALVLFSLYRPQIEQPVMDLHPGLMTDRGHKSQLTFVHHETCSKPPIVQSNAIQPLLTPSAFNHSLSWTGVRCLPRHVYSLRPKFGRDCSSEHFGWSTAPLDLNNSCLDAPLNQSVLPPWRLLPTYDKLINLTHFNPSTYFLQKRLHNEMYGGITLRPVGRHRSDQLLSNLVNVISIWTALAFESGSLTTEVKSNLSRLQIPSSTLTQFLLPPLERVTLWYNNKGYASAPAFLNNLFNLQLQQLRFAYNNENNSNRHAGIIVANYPLPFSKSTWFFTLNEALLVDTVFMLFIIIALTAIPANFATFIVFERHSGIKHLQRVSGLQPYVYWLVNFAWDFFVYCIPAFFCISLLAVFRKTAYISPSVLGPFVLIVILYGSAMTPFVYLATILFRHPSTAYVYAMSLNLFIASISAFVSLLIKLFLFRNTTETVRTTLEHVQRALLYIFPHHCFGSTVLDLAMKSFFREHGPFMATAFGLAGSTWGLLYPRMFYLMGQTTIFILLLLLVEYRGCFWYIWDGVQTRRRSLVAQQQTNGMNSVENEPLQLPELPTSEIRIQNLSKRYFRQPHPALCDLNLCIRAGECFGLIGTNGAGKSTTFGLLTGQFPAPRNTILLNEMDLSKQFFSGRYPQSIGFCPQQNALHSFLTARETLQSYASLRGISGPQLEATISKMITSTGLDAHTDRLVQTFSGGTKRKLSTAIAFIGDPQIILLDEPSSGMDPGARRLLWAHIHSALERQCMVLLSSHCMEECEALCNRVGLLVEGRLICDGSPLELKLRFAVGYSVDFDLTPSALIRPADQLQDILQNYLPDIVLSAPLFLRQQYNYPHDRPLSDLFRALRSVHELGIVQHFSVKHSNLEDAFVKCLSSCSTNDIATSTA